MRFWNFCLFPYLVLCVPLDDCDHITLTIPKKIDVNTIPKTTKTTTNIPKTTKTITNIPKITKTTTNIPKTTKTTTTTKTTINIPKTTTTSIPITFGDKATLTYFTDTVFQCTSETPEFGLAVNPLLLGFTVDDWNDRFANAAPSSIPWCGKTMKVTINGKTFIGEIIDTCNPGVGGEFVDPNTGEVIGGKCGYNDVIDFHGTRGLEFLNDAVGDNFYKGDVEWEILN